MDQRETFKTPEELKAILDNLRQEDATVWLLVDSEGLSRVSGKITALSSDAPAANATLQINDEKPLLLSEIVAVNGIFHADYSEC
jgi:hypothetical protein